MSSGQAVPHTLPLLLYILRLVFLSRHLLHPQSVKRRFIGSYRGKTNLGVSAVGQIKRPTLVIAFGAVHRFRSVIKSNTVSSFLTIIELPRSSVRRSSLTPMV